MSWKLLITPSPNLDVFWRFQNSWNQWIKFRKHFDSQKSSPDFCGFAVCHKAAWVEVPRWPWSSWKGARDPAMKPSTTLGWEFLLELRDLIRLKINAEHNRRWVDCIKMVSSYDPMLSLSILRVWHGGFGDGKKQVHGKCVTLGPKFLKHAISLEGSRTCTCSRTFIRWMQPWLRLIGPMP